MKSILVNSRSSDIYNEAWPPAHLLGHPAIEGRVKGGRADGGTADAKGAHIMAPLHTHTHAAERREGAEEEEDVTY